MKDFKETWLECWKAWGESKTMTILKLPKMVPDEECQRLLKWVDSLTIEEVQALEKIHKGECTHPGCCCVCGHTKTCPEDGPSHIEGIED